MTARKRISAIPPSTTREGIKHTRKIKETPSTLLDLDLFTRSLQEFYPNEPSCPGITISYLPGMQQYYASVVRFREMYGKNSYAIFNTRQDTIVECLTELKKMWLNKIQPLKSASEELLRKREENGN